MVISGIGKQVKGDRYWLYTFRRDQPDAGARIDVH